MLDPFLEVFAGTAGDPAALSRALEGCADAGAHHWPEVRVDRDAFARFLAARVPADADPAAAVLELAAADLWLACGCGAGDPAAIAAFEAELMPVVIAAVRGMRGSADAADEVAQELRERLLVGSGDRGPRILDYAGRGSLRRWLKATAVRTQLNRLRGGKREVLVDDAPVFDALAGPAQPELEPLRGRYREALADAFAAAMAALADRDKALLRLAYVERVGLGGLGQAFGVSRATAHRWLVKARQQLADGTESRLVDALGVPREAVASIRRLVQSQIAVSVERILAP